MESVELRTITRPISSPAVPEQGSRARLAVTTPELTPEEILERLLSLDTQFDTHAPTPERPVRDPEPLWTVVREICHFYEEAVWLTEEALETPEAFQMNQKVKFSQLISEDKQLHVEFDKTVVGILCILWVLKREYAHFTHCQGAAVKLTPESFRDLHEYTVRCLPDRASQEALVVATVLNDLGKVESLVEYVRSKTAVEEVDHDKILWMGLQHKPNLFKSYTRLDKVYQDRILRGLDAKFNFAQFVQGENVPASLTEMRTLYKDPDSLNLYILHALYDMAGAAATANYHGSLVLTEPVYRQCRLAMDSLSELSNNASFQEVCDLYYDKRGQALGLSAHFQTQRALIRLCCMLRLSKQEHAAVVTRAAESIPHANWASLRRELCVTGLDGEHAILVYYAPALLLNFQTCQALKSPEEIETKSPVGFENLRIGFLTLDKVFRQSRQYIADRTGSGLFTVDILDIAAKAQQIPQRFPDLPLQLLPVGDNAKMSVRLDS